MSYPTILLLTDRSTHRGRWAEALASLPAQVLKNADDLAPDATPDVIVTDTPRAHDDAGVIFIGPSNTGDDNAGDVCLPEDCTARELRLACMLLWQIVQLRREKREGALAHQALTHMVMTDPLTGIANRRAWDAELDRRCREKRNSGHCLAIALFDVDFFKRVNAACGLAAGDALLRTAAHQLAASVRPGDHVARLGGDEFGLLLDNLRPAAAGSVIERVRRSFALSSCDETPFPVTVSAGYALLPGSEAAPNEDSPEQLYAAAASALQQAKTHGRNRTVGPLGVCVPLSD